MTFITQILILISTLALWIPALAQSADVGGPAPLVLSDARAKYQLGQHMEILEDPTGKLTIQDVSSPAYSDRFVPGQSESPTFGYSASTYWVRFRLRSESKSSDHWLLEVGFPNIHYVDLYIPAPGEERFIAKQSGVLRPFNTRDIAYNRIVFDLPLAPNEEQIFYMRFQSGASMTLPLTLWFPEAFFQAAAKEQLILGLFYGMLLIILIYNLFLLFSLREASYLYYECFLASAILFFVSYDALADQYLWRDQFALINHSVPLFFILSLASITWFTDAFLEIKTRNPKLHRLIVLVMAGWGIALLLLPIVSYHVIFNLIAPFGVVSMGLAGAAGLISWRGGYRPARYFLLAWLGLILGVVILILVRLAVIPSTTFTEQFLRVGIIWLVAFWAIALADRINLLKVEKEKATLEVQASEARYRQLVETMNDGLAVIDKDGRYTYVNRRLAEMLGYSPDEVVGHLMTEFAIEEDRQILTNQMVKRKAGVTTPYELTWRRKDGSDLVTIVSPRPLFEAEGQYTGSFGVITDITERVQASRLLELRVSERTRELSTLLEISHEITTTQGLDDILNRNLELLKSILDYRHSAVLLIEEEHWRIRACWPAGLEKTDELFLSPDEKRRLAQAFEPGKPEFLNQPADASAQMNVFQPLAIQLSQAFQADDCPWLGIPLLGKDHLLGLFILGCAGQNGFSDDQVKVAVAFANQATIVIENHQLLDRVQATAAAEERNRLAQELHDSVTQVLFSIGTVAEVLPQIWQRDPKQGQEGLLELRGLTRGALAEMRTLLLELRPSAILKTPLSELLTQLTEAIASRKELSFQLYIEKSPVLPAEVQTTFYRVAQEAIHNVVRHSHANQVGVSLSISPPFTSVFTEDWKGEVKLIVSDDGSGFTPGNVQPGHFGLSIMQERAVAINATLEIESQPGLGTNIALTWRH
jgi:PAS domain S-box-containing protein